MGTVLGARDTNKKKKKTLMLEGIFFFICLIPSHSDATLTSIYITWALCYT